MDQDRIMRVARIVAAREKEDDSNYSNSNFNKQENGNQQELFYIPCKKKEEMDNGQKSTIHEIYMYLICNERKKREQLTETGVIKRTKKPDPRNYEKYE